MTIGSRILHDERGMALISSLGVALVMSLLTVVTVSLSFHNVKESAVNRERVQSIAAAEAGLNRMFAHLETATPETVSCTLEETLTTDPASSFTTTLYVTGPNGLEPLACPAAGLPSRIVARSTGHGLGDTPARTMESLINLQPITTGIFGPDAIFSNLDLTLNSNIQVEGDEGRNANIYSNDTVTLNSNVVITGSVFAQDQILMSSNSEVKKDVWARNSVTLDSNAIVRRNVTSSTSSVTVLNNAHVYGDVRAGTSINAGSGAIDGLRIPDSPSGPPPEKPFPAFSYVASTWQEIGYTVNTFTSCSSAKTFIQGITSGNHVVRINSTCELSWSGNDNVLVQGNLAIIHDGSFLMDNNSRFSAVGGPHELFLIVGLGGGVCDVRFKSNSSIGANIFTLMYTPCTIYLDSNSFLIEGQVLAGQAVLTSNTHLSYRPMVGPATTLTGYTVEPLYIREIIGT